MTIGLRDYWNNNKNNSLKIKLKNLKWELIYAWKRVWYGYDDLDVIELHWRFVEKYKAILKDLRKTHYGLFNIPEEYRKFYNRIYFTEEETNEIIDTMIFHLEMLDEDYVEKLVYGKNVYDDDYEITEDINMLERYKHISFIMDQNKEAFMKLFNLFFWDLWD